MIRRLSSGRVGTCIDWLTDTQIAQLRDEAAAQGDRAQENARAILAGLIRRWRASGKRWEPRRRK